MKKHLTVAYCTSRKNPHVEWFAQSLALQIKDDDNVSVVIVDRHADKRYTPATVQFWTRKVEPLLMKNLKVLCVPPKPCVWQGSCRLTKEDWFAASNSRNTALCLAEDGWIAYVDDLSVLMPHWLESVNEAMEKHYMVAGAYKKVLNLTVEQGLVKSFTEYPKGVDSRWNKGNDSSSVPISGRELFGCSCAMPVDDLLTINGWPEYCDGLGSEDYICGLVLNNAGFGFRYDRRMLTYESEESHWEEPRLRATDKGKSPNDKSHAALRMAEGMKYFDNYFGNGGIRKLRDEVLSGEPFRDIGVPDRDWYDGQLICEM